MAVITMIDKLVRYAHIIELNTESYRVKQAKNKVGTTIKSN